MSDSHTAAYPTSNLTRRECFDRLTTVFEDHHASFLGSARGLHWEGSLDGFAYDGADRDLDGFSTAAEAVEASMDWQCACFDFRLINSSFELHLYNPSGQAGTSVFMSFPHGLYTTATQDPSVALRWIAMLEDARKALRGAVAICGPDVPPKSYNQEDLLSLFQQTLRSYRPGAYAVHTIVCSAAFEQDLARKTPMPKEFKKIGLGPESTVITLLPAPTNGFRS